MSAWMRREKVERRDDWVGDGLGGRGCAGRGWREGRALAAFSCTIDEQLTLFW